MSARSASSLRRDLGLIDSILPPGTAAGARYPEARMAAVNR